MQCHQSAKGMATTATVTVTVSGFGGGDMSLFVRQTKPDQKCSMKKRPKAKTRKEKKRSDEGATVKMKLLLYSNIDLKGGVGEEGGAPSKRPSKRPRLVCYCIPCTNETGRGRVVTVVTVVPRLAICCSLSLSLSLSYCTCRIPYTVSAEIFTLAININKHTYNISPITYNI